MTEAVGGVMAALKLAGSRFRQLERDATGSPRPGAGAVEANRAAAEMCEAAISWLEAMLEDVPPVPARAPVETWAAQVESLRFGFDMGAQSVRYASAMETSGEWEGPVPPADVEGLIALFRAWLATRK